MSHHGIRCGIPKRQLLPSETELADLPSIELWPASGAPDASAPTQDLAVATGGGPRRLRAESPGLLPIAPEQLFSLPPLLRGLVPFPYVVGLAEVGESLIWLVDLKRYGLLSEVRVFS